MARHPLMNANRAKLLSLIQARPGLGIRDAGRRCGLPQGATAYHVERLIIDGHISTARFAGRRLLFPYKVAPAGVDLAQRVLLEDPHLFALYEWVRQHGPVAQNGILHHFPDPRTTVQHRLDRLVRGGVLRSEMHGRARLYEVA